KVLGGEAAHGMLALSPRAVARLESEPVPRPLPKIFRLTKGGKLIGGIFKGETINTPSMLCVEDAVDALTWAEGIGGLPALMARSEANLAAITDWVARTDWVDFLAATPDIRSPTSICLTFTGDWVAGLSPQGQADLPKRIVSLLDARGVAYDIGGYRDAPPGLRIWGGATVETSDIEALLPWIEWAYHAAQAEMAKAA
ncbi:MAG: phosphoserine aminotransferase, partial [Rhodospirillaceae bacterium]|nr:phosphoserine aminotransferase [Rhodospirillaceae bacterium]